MSGGFDAIVVGGGHNGLVAALRLARAGRRVVVCERRDTLGGLCAPIEFHPGFTVPGVLHDEGAFRPWLERELGIAPERVPAPAVWAPTPDGPGLLLGREDTDGLGSTDAAASSEWHDSLAAFAGPLRRLLDAPPPPLAPTSAGDLLGLGRQALALRRLGRARMRELLRLLPTSAGDWLADTFASPALAEALAAPAVVGTWLGSWSPGSAANLLFHEATAGRPFAAGPAALVAALAEAAVAAGAELRTGAEVAAITLGDGGVAGVELASGEPIAAPLVVATCAPPVALLELLPPDALPLSVEESLRTWRCRGTVAKLHVALEGSPEPVGRPSERIAALRVGGGDLDALERAFDAVKYRRLPERPHLDVRVPTASRSELAPGGHSVLSIAVSFVPHDLEGGWTAAARDELARRAIATLAPHLRGLEERIVARHLLAPPDLEAGWRLPGGHLHHGEHALDQLLSLRPDHRLARYRTPVAGLFLAGSGNHPGGGVTGVPGWLGSGAALEDAGG